MNPIASLFKKDVLRHPLVLLSILAVALIALGSGLYYAVATQSPAAQWASPTMGPISEVITGTGSVEPAQNPDLAFQSGGKVSSVNVSVGQHVSQGQVLAALDVGTLAAQRAGAVANLKAQEAKLSQLQAGPRGVDIASKQTAVDQANSTLSNLYASIPSNLAQAYDKSFSGIIASTDTLFSQPNSATPTLSFTTSNSQSAVTAANSRSLVNAELSQWKSEASTLSTASSQSQVDTALVTSLVHLTSVRSYLDTLLEALGTAVPSQNFSQSSVTTAQASVGTLRDTVNSLILSLQGLQQQVRTDKLAIQSAQDALNQTNAGSTPQDVAAQEAQVEAAQASIENINAMIANDTIIAPYSGVITSVAVKAGQIASPNTVAVSLAPESALQVVVYLTELDVAKIAAGNMADVTLDAYGAARVFPAKVVSIDRSPTTQNSAPAYKTTLQFATDDPSVSSGMTANVAITAAKKDSALLVPKTAILQNGTDTFILVPQGKGVLQKKVVVGLVGKDTVEITSGLTMNDQFLSSTK